MSHHLPYTVTAKEMRALETITKIDVEEPCHEIVITTEQAEMLASIQVHKYPNYTARKIADELAKRAFVWMKSHEPV